LAAASRLDTVQGLRAAAALLVVVNHSVLTLIEKAGHDTAYQSVAWMLGSIGVKIFFLISGFIMTVATHQDFGMNGASSSFLRRRFLRIVPLYWLATAVYVIKINFQGASAPVADVLRSLAFIPYVNHAGIMEPVYGLGWTLNYEMFFYLLFAMALLLPLRSGLTALIVALAAIVFAFKFDFTPLPEGALAQILRYWGHPIVLYFAGGILIGLVRIRLESQDRLLPIGIYGALSASLLVLAAFVVWLLLARSAGTPFPMEAWFAVPPMAFCAFAVDHPRGELLRPLFRTLGDASYSIYLTHSFLLGVSGRIWARLFGPAHAGWFVLAMVVGCSFLGVIVYRLVEKPLLSALRKGAYHQRLRALLMPTRSRA
jgi:exopolysaccharide production protein ExoZ